MESSSLSLENNKGFHFFDEIFSKENYHDKSIEESKKNTLCFIKKYSNRGFLSKERDLFNILEIHKKEYTFNTELYKTQLNDNINNFLV